MTTTTVLEYAIINLTTITLPLILIILRIERRLTKLETEHNIYHRQD